MEEDYFAYLLDGEKSEDEKIFLVSNDRAGLIDSYQRAVGDRGQKEEKEGADSLAPTASIVSDGFVGLLDRALQLGLSQSHLITIADTARPIFRSSAVRFQLLDPVSKQAVLLEKNKAYTLYGLSAPIYADFMVRKRRLNSLDEALRDLPGIALMGLVATFDAFIADCVREMLKRYPQRYTSSDKEVKVRDVLTHGSLDNFISSMIDDEVYIFSRGSHEEQIKFIEKNFDIPIAAHWKRYADYIEVFERRNLIAHGERLFNQRYCKICTAVGHSGAANNVGQPINLSSRYLRQAADLLVEFAVVLVLTLWRKHDNATESEAFDKINDITFELIQSGRYRSAAAIATAALDVKKSACSQLARGMITVNLASAQKHLKQNEAAIKTLNSIDWSASADNFQMCVASIREDFTTITSLMPKVSAAKSIDADSFRTWPVFSFVRDKLEFQEAFQASFGEPLLRVKESSPELVEGNALEEPTRH